MSPNVKTLDRTTLGFAVAMWMACTLVTTIASADEPRSETVKFADLNVATPGGAQALYGRIHAAARRVCEQPSGELEAVRSCMVKAERDAIGKANLPLLTAYWQKKSGTQPASIIASR